MLTIMMDFEGIMLSEMSDREKQTQQGLTRMRDLNTPSSVRQQDSGCQAEGWVRPTYVSQREQTFSSKMTKVWRSNGHSDYS